LSEQYRRVEWIGANMAPQAGQIVPAVPCWAAIKAASWLALRFAA
jgi:hypothetical protein